MLFSPIYLEGAMLIEPQRRQDARGWFARVFCEKEFAARGLTARMGQINLSFTRRAGTLRGMHYPQAPDAEDMLVRCARGAIWDAIIDLRPQSPTYCEWFGAELSEDNGRMLLVPQGFAHGFVSLTDDAAVTYQMSSFHEPQAQRGVRHDDPAFGIEWPVPVLDVSQADRQWPNFQPQAL